MANELDQRVPQIALLDMHREVKRLSQEECLAIARADAAALADSMEKKEVHRPETVDLCEKMLLMTDGEVAVETAQYLAVVLSQQATQCADSLAFGYIAGSLGKTMESFGTMAMDEAGMHGSEEFEFDNKKLKQAIDKVSAGIDACAGHVGALRGRLGEIKDSLALMPNQTPEEIKHVNNCLRVLEAYYQNVGEKVDQFRKIFDTMVSSDEKKASKERQTEAAKAAEPQSDWSVFKKQKPCEVRRDGCKPENLEKFRAALVRDPDTSNPDDFEKLLWLGGDAGQIASALQKFSAVFEKKQLAGWLRDEIGSERYMIKHSPAIKSGGFGFVLLALLALAAAVLIALHPAVAVFFENSAMTIMAVIGIIFFLLGVKLMESFVVGAIFFGVWAGVTYLINMVIRIDHFFRIVVVVLMLAACVASFVACRNRNRARRASINYRKEYFEKRAASRDAIIEYCDAAISCLEKVEPTLSESALSACKAAIEYYSKAKREAGSLRIGR